MGLGFFNLKIGNLPIKVGNVSTTPVKINTRGPAKINSGFQFGIKTASINILTKIPASDLLKTKFELPISAKSIQVGNISSIIPKLLIPSPKVEKRNYLSYSTDKLNVSDVRVKNNSFNPSEIDQNISIKRPELLMIYNFSPIFIGNPQNKILSNSGKLIEVQHQTSYLRRDILGELLLNIQNSGDEATKDTFGNLLKKFNQKLNDLDSLLSSYSGLLKNKEEIQQRFNLKSLSENSTTDIDKNSQTFSRDLAVQYKSTPSLKTFFTTKMGYTPEQFNKFTNTKIFIQLVSDLKNIVENYSFNLLDLKDADRKGDVSATSIDTTYTTTDNFTFNISKIRSPGEPINALSREKFNGFMGALPQDPASKIKILTTLLSKEYRISSELGDGANKKILDDFNSSNIGSPFDNILGLPGKTIFQEPSGEKSLLNLAQFKIDDSIEKAPGIDPQDFFVLPFEDKFIDFEKQNKTYVPGKHYFVDAIFETKNNTFNTAPLASYESLFSTKFNQSKSALVALLQLDVKNDLDPEEMIYSIINSCYASTCGMATDSFERAVSEAENPEFAEEMINQPGVVGTDLNQAIVASIMRLSTTDNELKNYLFQYLLLAGLSTNTATNSKIVWNALVNELQVLDKFDAIGFNPLFTERDLKKGSDVVKPHLKTLAKKIEDAVIRLVSKNAKPITSQKQNPQSTARETIARLAAEGGSQLRDLNSGEIAEALSIEFNSSNNNSNFFKQFLVLAEKFTQAAAIKNNETGFLLNDKSGRTRYNFISTSTQLLMLFEIISNFALLFSSVDLTRPSNSKVLVLREKNVTQKALFDVLTQFTLARALAGEQVINERNFLKNKFFVKNYAATTLVDILLKLREEDFIIVQTLSILESIKDSITRAKEISDSFGRYVQNNGSKFASDSNPTKETENYLTFIETLKNSGINNNSVTMRDGLKNLEIILKLNNGLSSINLLSNETQLKNTAHIIQTLKDKILDNLGDQNQNLIKNPNTNTNENIIISNEVDKGVKEVLYSYLSTPDFTDTNNANVRIKILSVGIPNGFSKGLVDRTDVDSLNKIGLSSLQKKQNDVLKIKIYKRNLQYDDLVFVPKEFIFDLSLYVTENNIISAKAEKNEMFNNILQRVSVTDYETVNNVEKYSLNQNKDSNKSIMTEQKYAFLNNDQKTELFTNHISSYLLENLLYLSTGFRVNEETFLTREEKNKLARTAFDQDFESVVKTYLLNVLKEPISLEKTLEQLRQDPSISQSAREMITMIKNGNILFNPDTIYTKAFGQKFFDRIFHVNIDIDSFEIDMEQTRKSDSGKKLLTKAFMKENIFEVGEKAYLKKRSDRDIVLEDYFINIENIT